MEVGWYRNSVALGKTAIFVYLFVFVSYNSRWLVLFCTFSNKVIFAINSSHSVWWDAELFRANIFSWLPNILDIWSNRMGQIQCLIFFFVFRTYQMVVFQANFNSSSVLGVSIDTSHSLAFGAEFWNLFHKAFFNFDLFSPSTWWCHSTLASFYHAPTHLQYFYVHILSLLW